VLEQGQGLVSQWVPRAALPGQPPIHDIARMFAAADEWAKANGWETGMPSFEVGGGPQGPTYELITFPSGLAWLHHGTVNVGATYQQPTFAEPGVVIRNINRAAVTVAQTAGHVYKAAFPTFVPDVPAVFSGRVATYDFYYMDDTAPVSWEDVSTSTHIASL
jgi:hypothetical protein